MALISTLTDNFNDNSIDGEKWTANTTAGGTITEVNQQLELYTPATAGSFQRIYSLNTYDLTASQATIKVIDAGTISSGYDFYALEIWKDAANILRWDIYSNGNIYVAYFAGAGEVDPYSAVYVAATYRYFRIRESGGTVYWDYSADGTTWTNAYSKTVATLFAVNSIYSRIAINSTAATTATTAKVDDFNILPSAEVPIIGVFPTFRPDRPNG